MKFADAMEKGSKMVVPVAGSRHDNQGRACALGMAEVAVKQSFGIEWPWTARTVVDFPCGCKGWVMVGGCRQGQVYEGKGRSFTEAIVHLFNYHVMTKKDWSMDRLIQWVRCVEDHKDHPEGLVEREEPAVAAI